MALLLALLAAVCMVFACRVFYKAGQKDHYERFLLGGTAVCVAAVLVILAISESNGRAVMLSSLEGEGVCRMVAQVEENGWHYALVSKGVESPKFYCWPDSIRVGEYFEIERDEDGRIRFATVVVSTFPDSVELQ